jgi:hypothetical protein
MTMVDDHLPSLCDTTPNSVTLNITYGSPLLCCFPHAPCHLYYDEAAYGTEAKYQQGRRQGGRCRGVAQGMAFLRSRGQGQHPPGVPSLAALGMGPSIWCWRALNTDCGQGQKHCMLASS